MIPDDIQTKADTALKRYVRFQWAKTCKAVAQHSQPKLNTMFRVTLSQEFRENLANHPVYRGDIDKAKHDVQMLYLAIAQDMPGTIKSLKLDLQPWADAFFASPYPIDLNAGIRPNAVGDTEMHKVGAECLSRSLPLMQSLVEHDLLSINDRKIHDIVRAEAEKRTTPMFEYALNHPDYDISIIPDSNFPYVPEHILAQFIAIKANSHPRPRAPVDRMKILLDMGFGIPEAYNGPNNAITQRIRKAHEAGDAFKAATNERKVGNPDLDSPYDITNLTHESCLAFTPKFGITLLVDPQLWQGHETQFRDLIMQFPATVRRDCDSRTQAVMHSMLEPAAPSWQQRVQRQSSVRERV